MPITANPRRVLYQFDWLAFRLSLSVADVSATRSSLRALTTYVNACPPHDPEINRLFRALAWLDETVAGFRKKTDPEVRLLVDQCQVIFNRRYQAIVAYATPITMTDAEKRRELEAAYQGARKGTFQAVWDDLEARFGRATDQVLKAELESYLDLMAAVTRDAAPA